MSLGEKGNEVSRVKNKECVSVATNKSRKTQETGSAQLLANYLNNVLKHKIHIMAVGPLNIN